jgi:Trk K+ transport system NAD-binding subunit
MKQVFDVCDLSDHVIVCGLGHMGYRISCLLTKLGRPGVAIARKANASWIDSIESSFGVLLGDAREDAVLRRAGIDRASAVFAVTDDDLTNVSIALDARRLNPKVVVIVRISDQRLAMHFEKAAHIDRGLSAPSLVMPAFVAASLGGTARGSFEAGGVRWTLDDVELPADLGSREATVAAWSNRLGGAPIVLHRGDETTLHPEAAQPAMPGDRLLLVSPVRSDPHRGRRAGTASPVRRRFGRAYSLGIVLREWWQDVPLSLRAAMGILAAFIALSVVVFRFALDMPWIDALYFVMTTITTVGYGDYSLKESSPWLMLYGSFVMLCGAAILAVLFSIVTDLVLQRRLRDFVSRATARREGHAIVAGLGNVGFRLVQSLVQHGESVVAVERRPDGDFVQAARELAPVVLGNAATEETLHKAGAAGAKVVIAATDDDLTNLSIGLAAKQARADCRVVVRIFDSTLAEKMKRELGVDAVLSMSAAAAPTFVGAALCRGALYGVALDECLVVAFHRTLAANDLCVGCSADRMADDEAAMWIRSAGAAGYRRAAAGDRLAPRDDVLGVWWRPFQPRGAS